MTVAIKGDWDESSFLQEGHSIKYFITVLTPPVRVQVSLVFKNTFLPQSFKIAMPLES
jgi:hypothetical protein